MKFTLNALGTVFVKWYSEFKTLWIWWKRRWSYVYDDKLGFRCLPLLYWFCWKCLQLTSPEGRFSAKENWKSASWITLTEISCDNLCSLLLTFYVMVDNVVGIILATKFNWVFNYFYFQLFRKFGIRNLAHIVN